MPHWCFLAMATSSAGMLVFGMYLQHVGGLTPCPMCIVQRYALIMLMLTSALSASTRNPVRVKIGGAFVVLIAILGAFVAARQSFLQWYPPEVASCGRDLYGMIENFPLGRVVPMLLKGSGDCSKVDWTFLGGSIANWSFVCFTGFGIFTITMLWFQTKLSSKSSSLS